MQTFKQFMALQENLWGEIPVNGRKPSDGRTGISMSSNQSGSNQSQPKFMKKKMRKK